MNHGRSWRQTASGPNDSPTWNDTTAVMVTPGVELKAGGKVADKAQLAAITVLALKTS